MGTARTLVHGGAIHAIDRHGWTVPGNPHSLADDTQRALIVDTSWDGRGRSAIVTGPATIERESKGSPERLSVFAVRGGTVETAKQLQGGRWVPEADG